MKNLFQLVLLLILTSCASNKYGRYFNNHQFHTHSESNSEVHTTQQVALIVSTSLMTTMESKVESKLDNPHLKHVSTEVIVERMIEYEISKENILKTHKSNISNTDPTTDERRIELHGAIGLIMMLLAPLPLYYAFGVLGLLLMLIGLVFAIASLVKIKQNKQKWKGRFFGIATILVLSLGLLFVGLASYYASATS